MFKDKIKFFAEQYKPHKKIVSFVIFGSLAASGLDLFSPMLIRYIMDEILPKGISGEIFFAAAGLLTIYVISYFLKYNVEKIGRTMGAKIEFSMREKLFRHLLRMGYSFFDNARSGQLLSRVVGDISEVGNLMFEIPHLLITCTITLVGASILLFCINPQLATIVVVLLIWKTIQSVKLNFTMKKMFTAARESTGDLSGQVSESLQGIRLIKTFHNEETELKKTVQAGLSLLEIQEKSFGAVSKLHSGVDFFSNLMHLTITVLGGILISMNLMTISDLVAFLLYMSACMRPVFQLMMLTEVYQKGMAGVYRYKELMDLPEGDEVSPERTEKIDDKTDERKIEFSHVNFAYDTGKNIFEDFNLSIAAGEHIGIVGMTGGGKTTLCELLLGLYELNGGKISINGTDIKKIAAENLRREIGMIQQDTFLFSASVRENISYGCPNVTDEEIENAARLAEAHEFIKNLPEGYGTFIGERGVKLSGGQKQRIAIARMFLRNPKILILDEATSALDNETERLVQRAMQKLSENRTTITVAHRLATVKNSDRIVVLQNGKIIEQGTHDNLIENRGIYYNLSRYIAA